MRRVSIILVPVVVVALSGCSGLSDRQQRAVTGGAMGAAGGAVIGLIAGGPLLGAAVGGAVGTAAGALLDKGINQ